ncbi:hypothetical protein GCG21_13420 [Pseudactinotalea sp. HY160]|nr:hypothetical protein [Pseudactinotalea sp. HY160]
MFDLIEYEEHLERNLRTLCDWIERDDKSWVETPEFTGSFCISASGFKREGPKLDVVNADAKATWESLAASPTGRKPEAEFRVMSECSIHMHVLSTHWILQVGEKMDRNLSAAAVGNRLNRFENRDINDRSVGTFINYRPAYSKWRNGALDAMSAAVAAGKEIITLAADARAFYHRLTPGFLQDPAYLREVLKVELSDEEHRLNRLFVAALEAWTHNITEASSWPEIGLPVGLPASAVVANLALAEFDRIVVDEVKPIHYGRYVDDLIIVLGASGDLSTVESVWGWIAARSAGQVVTGESLAEYSAIASFSPTYLPELSILFAEDKSRLFCLKGESGQAMLGALRHEIDMRSSEWRSLKPIAADGTAIARDLVELTTAAGDRADTLRGTDDLSVRRSKFAIQLREFESYARDVSPESWQEQRRAFIRTFVNTAITPQNFFEFSKYVSRIIRMAASCGEWKELKALIDCLGWLVREIRSKCEISIKGYGNWNQGPDLFVDRWVAAMTKLYIAALLGAAHQPKTNSELATMVGDLKALGRSPTMMTNLISDDLAKWQEKIFLSDLGEVAVRYLWLDDVSVPAFHVEHVRHFREQFSGRRGWPKRPFVNIEWHGALVRWMDLAHASRGHSAVATSLGVERSSEEEYRLLELATRPPNELELELLAKASINSSVDFDRREIGKILAWLRGSSPSLAEPLADFSEPLVPMDSTSRDLVSGEVRVALTMVATDLEWLNSAALGAPVLTRSRYDRLKSVLSDGVHVPGGVNYVVLPEVSMPASWFIPMARRLRRTGTSLIAGIEYRRVGNAVFNQAWASLVSSGPFGGHEMHIQNKRRAAIGEHERLLKLDPNILYNGAEGASVSAKDDRLHPRVIKHEGFKFAILICSELTNINYRANLRGEIDALFVLEWNRDLETFDALVRSAALDVHAYVIQVNHRKYGDSRIRGPMKQRHLRDVVQIRGGEHDYSVTARINFRALREFQSVHGVTAGHFKPLPEGFMLASDRRVVPSIVPGWDDR